jgi:hypothetical protein
MTDDVQASGGSFAEMDPRLTVFALANGVDLSKREGYRRLEWFSDGFERGIVIALAGDGTFRVGVLKWKSGTVDEIAPTPVDERLSSAAVVSLLVDAIDTANGL